MLKRNRFERIGSFFILVHAFRLSRGPLTENIHGERQRRFLCAAFRVERQRDGVILRVIGFRPCGHAEVLTQARKLRVRLIPVDLAALRAPPPRRSSGRQKRTTCRRQRCCA